MTKNANSVKDYQQNFMFYTVYIQNTILLGSKSIQFSILIYYSYERRRLDFRTVYFAVKYTLTIHLDNSHDNENKLTMNRLL
jgi:hypothetical protein